jgi:hypothetical protein
LETLRSIDCTDFIPVDALIAFQVLSGSKDHPDSFISSRLELHFSLPFVTWPGIISGEAIYLRPIELSLFVSSSFVFPFPVRDNCSVQERSATNYSTFEMIVVKLFEKLMRVLLSVKLG